MGQSGTRVRRIVRALIEHATIAKAANAAGCSRSTIYRMLRDPEFLAALEDARQIAAEAEVDALVDVRRKRSQAARAALDFLIETMARNDAPLGVRVRIAQGLLADTETVGERLAEWSKRRRDPLRRLGLNASDSPASRAEARARRLVE